MLPTHFYKEPGLYNTSGQAYSPITNNYPNNTYPSVFPVVNGVAGDGYNYNICENALNRYVFEVKNTSIETAPIPTGSRTAFFYQNAAVDNFRWRLPYTPISQNMFNFSNDVDYYTIEYEKYQPSTISPSPPPTLLSSGTILNVNKHLAGTSIKTLSWDVPNTNGSYDSLRVY